MIDSGGIFRINNGEEAYYIYVYVDMKKSYLLVRNIFG